MDRFRFLFVCKPPNHSCLGCSVFSADDTASRWLLSQDAVANYLLSTCRRVSLSFPHCMILLAQIMYLRDGPCGSPYSRSKTNSDVYPSGAYQAVCCRLPCFILFHPFSLFALAFILI
jgi:hypothetical protein